MALALVMPVNGLQTATHLLVAVHPIFPHGHPASVRGDGAQDSAIQAATTLGASAATMAPAGPFGPGLAIALTGINLTMLAGTRAVATSRRLPGGSPGLDHQAWPGVPTEPPR